MEMMEMGEEHFFETSATLITFVILGRLLEQIAKSKTNEAISKLVELQPTVAALAALDPATGAPTGEAQEVEVALLQRGDVVKVVRGNRVPADGVILQGQLVLDQSMLTGESMPVTKGEGEAVTGATVVVEGTAYVTVKQVGSASTLSQILKMMEDAQTRKVKNLFDEICCFSSLAFSYLSICTFLLSSRLPRRPSRRSPTRSAPCLSQSWWSSRL